MNDLSHSLFVHAGGRLIPSDFRDTFIMVGWESVEDHYRAHKRTIRRWIGECDAAALQCGGPLLGELRAAHLAAENAKCGRRTCGRKPDRSRAARYVMGRTLRGVKPAED